MRRVFADTVYWVALANPNDQWHQAALRASRRLAGWRLVTTDEVLVEVLAAFGESGPHFRQNAAALARDLQSDPTVTTFPQSRQTSLNGIALYENRPDKGYSLTDCISMVTMRQEGITDVQTQDAHFTQEGFTILL